MTGPRISVVVPTYERVERLPALVDSLRAQTIADFEVVIVDNASSDGTTACLEQLVGGDDRFRLMRIERNRGPAGARNVAWRRAQGPWVAFTDDDCVPRHDWLEALLAASAEHDLIQGRTEPAAPPDGPFARTQRIEGWSGRFQTCNLAVRRSLLERTGGFDERFVHPMGEDTDFGFRAMATGARATFADDAVVRHAVLPSSFRTFLRYRRRYADVVEMFRVNPDTRSLLRWGLVARDVHLLVWGLVPITVVAVASGHRWIPAVVVLGWSGVNTFRTRGADSSKMRRFAGSLLQFTGYAYETACFAAASVRYRRLVL